MAIWERGLEIIDINNKDKPKFISCCNQCFLIKGIALKGDHAYAIDEKDGFFIIDTAIKGNPTIIGNCSLEGNPTALTINGDYAYVTTDTANRLYKIDVSDPSSPGGVVGQSSSDLLGASDVFVRDGYAYVTAATINALVIFDLSDPTFNTY